MRKLLGGVDDVSPVDIRVVVMSFNKRSSGFAERLNVVLKIKNNRILIFLVFPKTKKCCIY